MTGIIEQAGLTRAEIAALARSDWPKYHWEDPWNIAVSKLVRAVQAEAKALKPLEPGDRVTFPFGAGEVFEVICIHNKWVVGVGDDGIPVALNLNAVERADT